MENITETSRSQLSVHVFHHEVIRYSFLCTSLSQESGSGDLEAQLSQVRALGKGCLQLPNCGRLDMGPPVECTNDHFHPPLGTYKDWVFPFKAQSPEHIVTCSKQLLGWRPSLLGSRPLLLVANLIAMAFNLVASCY